MTNEEMAAELRKAGWRVQEPLTPQNCPHQRMQGSGAMGCDGSGSLDQWCPDCGFRRKEEWGPRQGGVILAALN